MTAGRQWERGPALEVDVITCACGHEVRLEVSDVDGRGLWFHAGLEGVEGGWAACGCDACHRAAGVVPSA